MDKIKPKEKAHVLKNVAYMHRIGWETSPVYVIMNYFCYIGGNIYSNVVMCVLFLKIALEIIEKNLGFEIFAKSIIFIVAVSLLFDVMFKFTDEYLYTNFAIKVEQTINRKIFGKAQESELACFENPDFYDKYTRATYVITKYRNSGIIANTAWALGSLISFIVIGVYMASLDPMLIVFIVSPVAVIFFKNRRSNVEFQREKAATPYERRKDYVKRTVLLKDFAKEIKTTNIFAVIKKYFNSATEKKLELIRQYGKKMVTYELLCKLFDTVLPIGGGIVYACYRLFDGNLSVSDFAVLVSAVFSARERLENFTQFLMNLQQSCYWIQSLREFLAYEPKIKGGDKISEDFESLEFRNVSFRYTDGGKDVMKNVSFRINRGETIAVVGHNGAGKTTFSKLLMRLYDVTEGEILYNGINIKEYDLGEYRKRFASVFQDYKIFAMTAAENVLMREVDDENVKIAEKAIELGGVGEKFKAFPNGVNTVMTKEFDDNGASLSGGESQKLAISRLFSRDYDIAVLDEPSSALDPIAESEMYKNLKTGTKGKTVIYISHRLSSAADSDRILVFSDGCLAENGTHEELMALGGEYEKLFTLQASGYREVGDNND